VGDTSCPDVVCVTAADPSTCTAEQDAIRSARGNSYLPTDTCLVYDFHGEYYTCTTTSSFVYDLQINGSVSLFMPTLNDTEVSLLAKAISSTEGLDRQAVQAWAETNVVLVGCLLLITAFLQIILLITNRIIIKWNEANNWPHGKDPYLKMLHVAAHKSDMRAKMLAMRAFKSSGSGLLGHKNIKVID
jgi:hypothetical protein